MPTTPTKQKRRPCNSCGSGTVARWPKHDPHFCNKTCAAKTAYQDTSMRWCETHREWFHEDDGCYDCEKEGGDNGDA